MSVDAVRDALERRLESAVEVGTYRGVDGIWAKVELDPRITNSMRPTSLACDGTRVEEMKVRFRATTADRDIVIATLGDLEALTPADGAVSAENHELSAADEWWPHIFYEDLPLATAVQCLVVLEGEPLPTYGSD